MSWMGQKQRVENVHIELAKQQILFPSAPSTISLEIPNPTKEDKERAFWIVETQANAPIHEREVERRVWTELHLDRLKLIVQRRLKPPNKYNEAEGAKNFTGGFRPP